MAEISGWAAGNGLVEQAGGRWELHMNWRSRRVRISCWRDRLDGNVFVLADGRGHSMCHFGRVDSRAGTGRGDGACSLAAVASMRELMVMKTASQLSLFQVSGNVLVGHLLETSLKKIDFLQKSC